MTSLGEEVKLVMLLLLVAANSGPPHSLEITAGVTSARLTKKYSTWLNPCRHQEVPKLRHKTHRMTSGGGGGGGGVYPTVRNVMGRNKASPRPLRRVRIQITNTWRHLETEYQQLAMNLCNEVWSLGRRVQYDWLPKNQSKWYKEHIKCLEKKNKVLVLLPTLQMGLQNFSASFDKLRQHNEKKSNEIGPECDNKRQKAIISIADKLDQLLCEVDKAIVDMRIPPIPPYRLSEEDGRNIMTDYGTDFTTSLLYEWGIMFAYQAFLDDWNRIIRHLVGKKGQERPKCKSKAKRRPKHS